MPPRQADNAGGDASLEHPGGGRQPKSYKWLRPKRWKLNGKNNGNNNSQKETALPPERERRLEADLAGLAALTAATSMSTGNRRSNTVVLWSVEALQSVLAKGEMPWRTSTTVTAPSPTAARKGSSDKRTANCLNNDAQIVLVQDTHYMSCLLALKRLPSTTATRGTNKKLDLKKKLATAELVKEAKILAHVGTHPNILALRGLPTMADGFLSSCVNDDAFFFLTDPLHRETLDTRIRSWRQKGTADASSSSYFKYGDTRIPDEEMIPRKSSYAYQIAKALQGCHQAGIVVRDLSPLKIGFRRDDPHVVQLFDIGHAVTMEELEDSAPVAVDTVATPPPSSTIVGKRRYMAGEIWRTGQYSKESDVYSWAMIFYEMLAESKPFHGLTAQDHQKLVCGGPAKRPPLQEYCLPQGMETLLEKAWHQCPSLRPSTDRLCQEMQNLVLHLDAVLLYEEEHVTLDPNDFLLEVHVEASTDEDGDDDISELGDTAVDYDDELLALMQGSPVTEGVAGRRTLASGMGGRFGYTGDDEGSILSSTSSTPLGNIAGLSQEENNSRNNNDATAESNDTTVKIPSRAPSICTTTLSSGPENKIAPSAA